MVDFNLQQFLQDMRDEQKNDHKELSEKVDKVIEKQHNLDTRIVVVENTRKNLRWAVGVVIAALLGGVVDLAFNHFKTEPTHVAGRDGGGGDVRGRDVQPAAARGSQRQEVR